MQKIMFNDKYGLTKAVLKGRKTMTRRIIPQLVGIKEPDISEWGMDDGGKATLCLYEGGRPTTDIYPRYQPCEVVAIAQSYEILANSGTEQLAQMLENGTTFKKEYCGAGWSNKMFVRADLMPHHIRITDIKVERLQDISDEDCLCEGIRNQGFLCYHWDEVNTHFQKSYRTCRDAFASLIDKVSGKGTWNSNPYVFAYTFELVD